MEALFEQACAVSIRTATMALGASPETRYGKASVRTISELPAIPIPTISALKLIRYDKGQAEGIKASLKQSVFPENPARNPFVKVVNPCRAPIPVEAACGGGSQVREGRTSPNES
jgi:hypothetical protein